MSDLKIDEAEVTFGLKKQNDEDRTRQDCYDNTETRFANKKVTLQEDVNLARSEPNVKIDLDEEIDSKQLQLVEPTNEGEDDAVKKGVLVA